MDWRYHLLRKTGYSSYSEETSGKTLEFIGTSGVGKTTLFKACKAQLRKRWFFATHLDFIKRQEPACETDEILMQILRSRVEKIYNSDSFCPWHSLIDLRLSVRVMHETMLVAHSAHPKGFAFAEGLFRHFSAEILELGEVFPTQLWQNRAFVFLRARTPETALSRLKSREMMGARTERQRIRTGDQILSSIMQDQQLFQSIVDRAPVFGCPVLVLEAENPIRDSVSKVIDFERSLDLKFKTQEKTIRRPNFFL